ncbi:MAG: hypothetical protein LC126_18220 [Bryobacterales bacterium]|nr:hypothetical protein [Bryobacterales bacterium]
MLLRRTIPFLASWFGQPAAAATPRRDFFAGLNLRSPITAAEPFTTLSGSLMQPEVAKAWQYAVSRYARLDELHDATGKRIAAPIGCEAAMGHSHSRHRRLPHRIGPRENPRLPGATGM